MNVFEITISQTDAQLDKIWAGDEKLGVDLVWDGDVARLAGMARKDYRGPGVECGDRVCITTRTGSVYVGEVTDVEEDRGKAWIEGR